MSFEDTGFLTEYDRQALSIRFNRGIQAREALVAQIRQATLRDMPKVVELIRAANEAIAPADRSARGIKQMRASKLYPSVFNKGKRAKKGGKLPLRARIAGLDLVDYVNIMSPVAACGLPVFKTSWESLTNNGQLEDEDDIRARLRAQWSAYVDRHPDEGYLDILKAWFEEVSTKPLDRR